MMILIPCFTCQRAFTVHPLIDWMKEEPVAVAAAAAGCQVCVRTPNCTLSGFPQLRSRGVYLLTENVDGWRSKQQQRTGDTNLERPTFLPSSSFLQTRGSVSRGMAIQWIGDEKGEKGGVKTMRVWDKIDAVGTAINKGGRIEWLAWILSCSRKTCSCRSRFCGKERLDCLETQILITMVHLTPSKV